MATVLKAFVEVIPLIDNKPGEVNAIGEMTFARTYSTDIRIHRTASRSDYTVNVFLCKKDGSRIVAPQAAIDKITEITEKIRKDYDGMVDGKSWLEDNVEELEGIEAGETILEQEENWINTFSATWVDEEDESYSFEIYYAQEKMRDVYEPFEVRVVPPIVPITSLYNPYDKASEALTMVTPSTRASLEEATRDGTNYTEQRMFELKWRDPANPTKKITTYWTILCYGPRANRVENILAAIRKYLTDHSEYTVEQWKEYFPDLLTVEKFTILPYWEQSALSAGPNNDTVYSPIVRLSEVGAFAKKFMPSYDKEKLLKEGEVSTHIWRGLQFFVMGGPTNTIEKKRFSLAYPDYAILGVNDQNLSELDSKTKNAIEAIEKLARIANEYIHDEVTLPNDINEVYQDGILFLEKAVDGVSLRILTREAYSKK